MDKYNLTEQEVKAQLAALEKVKHLFLLPEYDCMTLTQMAEYFEVSPDCIKRLYQRRQAEFDDDGVCIRYPTDFKIFNGTKTPIRNMRQEKGKLIFDIDENTKIVIPNRGIRCFPKRAIVRVGMMLTGSRITKELRNQILNAYERTTPEQRTRDIDRERELWDNFYNAIMSGDPDEAVEANKAYMDYVNRYRSTD